jgi:hypothetical protein
VQAIAALPEIIKSGIYLESDKPDGDGNIRHIFAAKMSMNGEPLVVGFVVKEHKDGKKYYDHEVTEIENLGSLALAEKQTGTPEPHRDSVMNIVRKHLGVNPDFTLNSGPRGSVTFGDGETVIRLFKDSADFSTFVHEIGHLFVKDMEELAAVNHAMVLEALGGEMMFVRF